MSNETSSSVSPWVKASERLPGENWFGLIKSTNEFGSSIYLAGEIHTVRFALNKGHTVVWLDELIITSLQEENKQLKIDRNNIQDERMKWEARFNEVIKENQHIINHGPHFIDEVGPLIRANRRKEIQISKITELLNDKAKEWYSLKSKE